MAVAFDLPPTTEAEAGQLNATDLANPGPVDSLAHEHEEATDLHAAVHDLRVKSANEELNISILSAFEAAISKWEQDCNEATKQHAIWIEQTKDQMIGLDKKISSTAEQLKSLKDQKKGAVERLIQLETNGPEFPPKPTEEAVRATIQSSQKMATAGVEAGKNTASTEPNTDNTWRAIPTLQILKGIERLGAKKIESIVDEFPTLGDLEDIRGQASIEFCEFREKLPKGVGREIAEKIEKRMEEEIGKYSPDLIAARAKSTVVDEVADEDIDEETGEVATSPADVGVEYETVSDDEPPFSPDISNDLDDL